jgi:hypothetical protein
MKLFLLALCLWPFCHKAHVEQFDVVIPASGRAVVPFKKPFKTRPLCASNSRGLEWTETFVAAHGASGARAIGVCK